MKSSKVKLNIVSYICVTLNNKVPLLKYVKKPSGHGMSLMMAGMALITTKNREVEAGKPHILGNKPPSTAVRTGTSGEEVEEAQPVRAEEEAMDLD